MKYLSIVFVLTLALSCSPKIYYLGDSFAPTMEVDTYYSPEDIEKDFRVIGQLTGANDQSIGLSNSLEDIKNAMISQAKSRGANGILFLYADTYDNNHNVRADLLRYKE